MRIAERQLQGVALHLRAVADALDLKLFLEAVGHAGHQVLHHGAGHAPLLAGALGLAARLDRDGVVRHGERHVVGRGEAAAPLGPFTSMVWPETEAVTPDGSSTGFLPIRDIAILLRIPCRALRRRHWPGVRSHRSSRPRRRDDGHTQTLTDLRDVDAR
jgi:hypothetical protein